MTTVPAHAIDYLLPQTQCRECGYNGCLPYAEALAAGEAAVNLCAPGGEAVMLDIAGLLNQTPLPPAKTQATALAWIDEAACIGCTACIRACPVDAIMGASKFMHTVIQSECTGCGLCLAPCPVDCIHMQPIGTDYLPKARHLAHAAEPRFAAAGHARARYEWHTERTERNAAERKAHLAARDAAAKARLHSQPAPSATASGTSAAAGLIAQAMARAQAQQAQRTVPANRESFQAQQIEAAQERATYRRAMRDVQYGTEAEKAAAIDYLRAHKAAQEEKASKSSS